MAFRMIKIDGLSDDGEQLDEGCRIMNDTDGTELIVHRNNESGIITIAILKNDPSLSLQLSFKIPSNIACMIENMMMNNDFVPSTTDCSLDRTYFTDNEFSSSYLKAFGDEGGVA